MTGVSPRSRRRSCRPQVLRATFKLPKPLLKRDIVWLSTSKALSQKHFVCMARSVAHPAEPKRAGRVRAELATSGYTIKPADGSGLTAEITYIVQIDPHGIMPGWLLKAIALEQAGNLVRLRNYFSAKNPLESGLWYSDAPPPPPPPTAAHNPLSRPPTHRR